MDVQKPICLFVHADAQTCTQGRSRRTLPSPPQLPLHVLMSRIFQAGFFTDPFGNALQFFAQYLHTRT